MACRGNLSYKKVKEKNLRSAGKVRRENLGTKKAKGEGGEKGRDRGSGARFRDGDYRDLAPIGEGNR